MAATTIELGRDFMDGIPELIGRWMESTGRYRKDLAKMVGVSPKTITRWMEETNTPDRENQQPLANALGIDIERLKAAISVTEDRIVAREKKTRTGRPASGDDFDRHAWLREVQGDGRLSAEAKLVLSGLTKFFLRRPFPPNVVMFDSWEILAERWDFDVEMVKAARPEVFASGYVEEIPDSPVIAFELTYPN